MRSIYIKKSILVLSTARTVVISVVFIMKLYCIYEMFVSTVEDERKNQTNQLQPMFWLNLPQSK